jgi:hypothetical protein
MKVLIIITDGVGLKNFSFGKFSSVAQLKNIELIYWNKTKFNLVELGLTEIKLSNRSPSPLTSILKTSKTIIFLNYYRKKFNNEIFSKYLFNSNKKGFNNIIKNLLVSMFTVVFQYFRFSLQSFIHFIEMRTDYYHDCLSQVNEIKPDFVFASNQRSVLAISPLLAAKKIGVPSASFIFSWDNLPKATMVVESDFYFVWSEYMKMEVSKYYQNILPSQVLVTGTPQFEPHFFSDSIIQREEFFQKFNLDYDLRYICFSGDDITTSPFDPIYLESIVKSIVSINEYSIHKYGIIFRKCPTDFSGRYDFVIDRYPDLVFPIDPDWAVLGDNWDDVMPMENDLRLLVSTIFYSDIVINLGSTMVFDALCLNKPCLYINYDVVENNNWSTKNIYKFIHFKSMPSLDSVFWLNSRDSVEKDIFHLIQKLEHLDLSQTKKWFEKIVSTPADTSSERILEEITKLVTAK